MRLEDVTAGAQILGIAGDAPVTVVAVTWIGKARLPGSLVAVIPDRLKGVKSE
jgi:hypothetical protein